MLLPCCCLVVAAPVRETIAAAAVRVCVGMNAISRRARCRRASCPQRRYLYCQMPVPQPAGQKRLGQELQTVSREKQGRSTVRVGCDGLAGPWYGRHAFGGGSQDCVCSQVWVPCPLTVQYIYFTFYMRNRIFTSAERVQRMRIEVPRNRPQLPVGVPVP